MEKECGCLRMEKEMVSTVNVPCNQANEYPYIYINIYPASIARSGEASRHEEGQKNIPMEINF